MRIAIAISQAPPIASGVVRIAARLEPGFREQGHIVDVYSASGLPRFFVGEYRFVNVLPLFRDLLDKERYDVIHIHGPVPTFSDVLLLLCAANRSRLGCPRIVYSHHWDVDVSRVTAPISAVYNWFSRAIARRADLVVLSSATYSQSFVGFVPTHRRRVIPLGADSCFQCELIPPKPDQFTAVYVGQLRPYKGLDILLRAFEGLASAKLVVVGDGYCRDKYVQLADTLDLDNVVFKGRVSDEELKSLYAGSHVIVLPSISRLEAFGIVLLEAMGAGCVPVVSDLPGLRDTIGDSGLVFDVRGVGGLARALRLLMSEPDTLESLSRRAHARSTGFSWDITCRNYLAAFADVRRQDAVHTQVDPVSLSFFQELRFPSPL